MRKIITRSILCFCVVLLSPLLSFSPSRCTVNQSSTVEYMIYPCATARFLVTQIISWNSYGGDCCSPFITESASVYTTYTKVSGQCTSTAIQPSTTWMPIRTAQQAYGCPPPSNPPGPPNPTHP